MGLDQGGSYRSISRSLADLTRSLIPPGGYLLGRGETEDLKGAQKHRAQRPSGHHTARAQTPSASRPIRKG
jgi:hypothetical protein